MSQQNPLKMPTISIKKMFDEIAHKYDMVNTLISLGQDKIWRETLIKSCATVAGRDGILYDIATGTGEIIFASARLRNDYQTLSGYDISPKMLEKAQLKLGKEIQNTKYDKMITFTEAPAHVIPVPSNSAHAITVGFGVRNFEYRAQAFTEFLRILKPEGTLSILEILPSESATQQKIFSFYFSKVMPKIAALMSNKEAYKYLHTSVAGMPNATELIKELQSAGFKLVSKKTWVLGAVNLLILKKDAQ